MKDYKIVLQEDLYNSIAASYEIGEVYDLKIPAFFCSKNKNKNYSIGLPKISFEFLGITGDLFQFKAVPGGWTITLSYTQLINAQRKAT